MLKEILENIVKEKKQAGMPDFVIKNFLKEYLQYPVLDFIYNSQDYKNFIFTGGSCLRVCFNSPRLSEDLDFDLKGAGYRKFKINRLEEDLKTYFKDKFLTDIKTKKQGNSRLYLKFPILKDLKLADEGESDLLYVKIEPSRSIFAKPKIEPQPISGFGFNFVVQRYKPEFLMAGKLNAIFTRQWFKGSENEINIKGRDFYDLYWYWENKIQPDYKALKRLINIANETQLKKKLKEKIAKYVTTRKLSYDLKNFFPNQNFVGDFCKNYKKIMEKFLK